MFNELIGEFVGTAVLVLLGDSVVAGVTLNKTKNKDGGWIVIALAWGLAVTMGVFASGGLSPAHLNPAVSLGFAFTGDLAWSSFIPYVIAQLLGGFVGALITWVNYKPHYDVTEDPETILGTFATTPAIRNYFYNFVSEVIGSFILVFGIMMFGMFDISEGLNPLVVGSLIVVIGLSLGGTTGYAINPARDLPPRIAHAILPISNKGSSDWAYSWIPVVAPLVGAGLAAAAYLGISAISAI